MGDLGQITSLWALVSPCTNWDFWVRVLGCVDVQPNLVPPPPTAWLQPVRMPREVGWGKALLHWGAAGTWGAEREEPQTPRALLPMKGSPPFHFTWELDLNPHTFLPSTSVSGKASVGAPPSVAPAPAPGSLHAWSQRAVGFSHPEPSPW